MRSQPVNHFVFEPTAASLVLSSSLGCVMALPVESFLNSVFITVPCSLTRSHSLTMSPADTKCSTSRSATACNLQSSSRDNRWNRNKTKQEITAEQKLEFVSTLQSRRANDLLTCHICPSLWLLRTTRPLKPGHHSCTLRPSPLTAVVSLLSCPWWEATKGRLSCDSSCRPQELRVHCHKRCMKTFKLIPRGHWR